MDHYKLVMPEALNHYGFLFGGNLLKWIDEFAYITANLDYPENRFATVALDNVEFKHSIHNGEILRFSVTQCRKGTTSVSYNVKLYGSRDPANRDKILFETCITFVNLNEKGQKEPIQEKK